MTMPLSFSLYPNSTMACDFAQSKLPTAHACLQRPYLSANRPAMTLRSQRNRLHPASSRFLSTRPPASHPWSRCNSSLLDQAWGTHINAQVVRLLAAYLHPACLHTMTSTGCYRSLLPISFQPASFLILLFFTILRNPKKHHH